MACAAKLVASANPASDPGSRARLGKLLILEASDRVGGRIRSDVVDGFTLDHGFQVLLTAYPACRELLDYDALRLRRFEPGALIRQQGAFKMLADPWRRPVQGLATATNPVGSLGDKLRVARLRHASRQGSLTELYQRAAQPAIERLRDDGFSAKMIDEFFRPFLGGVFLDESLSISSRMLEFVFRMFASGDIAVPADGMVAIARQLAERLPRGTVRFTSPVTKLDVGDVDQSCVITMADGTQLTADQVVIATESSAASRLLNRDDLSTPWSGTTTLYYACEHPPDDRRLLMLRGDESGVIETLTVMSNIAPEYAPAGKALVSVSIDQQTSDPENSDGDELQNAVRDELTKWFGSEVATWRHLRTYRVPYALPKRPLDEVLAPVRGDEIGLRASVLVCGDHRETPSIQGAMNSGIRAAEAITRHHRRVRPRTR